MKVPDVLSQINKMKKVPDVVNLSKYEDGYGYGYGFEIKMVVIDHNYNISLTLNDKDDNEYFTKNDTIEIRGLEKGTEYTLKILLWGDFPLYELDAVA